MSNIQSICSSLGETGCCLFSFLYSIGVDPLLAVRDFDALVSSGAVAKDCTVQDYSKVALHYGHRVDVQWKKPDEYIHGAMYLGKWSRGAYSHFVVMKDGKVVWNPLDHSKCVDEGVLKDIRVVQEL